MIARLYDFAPNTDIVSQQVDDELNQIINALTGVKVNSPYILRSNGGGSAALTVDNTGGGPAQSWQLGGVEKLKVTSTGALQSLVATGTAPLIVASTTVVANLNADLLDGLEAAVFARTDAAFSITADAPYLGLIDSGAGGFNARVKNDGGLLTIENVSDGNTPVGVDLVYGHIYVRAAAPVSADHLTRKDYVDGRRALQSVGAYYDGAPAVGQKAYIYTAPTGVLNLKVLSLLVVSEMTGGSGTTTFELKKYVADFSSSTSLGTVSLTGSVSSFAKAATDVDPDVAVVAGEHLVFSCTAIGTHTNISISAQISQTLA